MSLLLATAGENLLTDTFLMARRHTVWPILNTAETGTWAWSGDAGKMFGGTYTNTSNTANDSISFDNLNLFSASAAINLLYTKASTGGVAKVYWGTKGEAGDLLGTIDMYAASTQKNQVAQFSLGTVTKARKTLHIVMETAGTGGGYTCQIQQAEVVQFTGSNLGDSIDDLPWWVDVPPFAYSASSGFTGLFQSSGRIWGSYIQLDGLGSHLEIDVGLSPGTYSLRTLGRRNLVAGVVTSKLNGTSIGSFDWSTTSGSADDNLQQEISSIAISSPSVHTFRTEITGQTTGYFRHQVGWHQFRKTSAHGAITPTGATYGRETAELWPWFADNKNGMETFVITASQLHYGWQGPGSPWGVGDWWESEVAIMPGTWDWNEWGVRSTDQGIGHLKLDGSEFATIDRYGSTSYSHKFSATGNALSSGTLRLSVDSKNVSASIHAYHNTMVRLTRTGA